MEVDLRLNADFEAAGETTFACTLGKKTEFRFTWMGVVLSAHDMILGKRESKQITARFDAPGGQDTQRFWESDDPTVCGVDQDGYLKAGNGFGDTVVRVTFEEGGVSYTDECNVRVMVPVEKVKLGRSSVTLQPGGARQMKVTVSPRKATHKEVTWHTRDANVARVDRNGLVTAVAPGETTVYALTEDGHYKSSCTVTVGGGG
jgi:uncharacterized protein YjdB